MRQRGDPRAPRPSAARRPARARALQVLLGDPAEERYGLRIGTAAGLPSGTVHPISARLEGVGWLESRWEDIDPSELGRPPRRYYRFTGAGAKSARAALARVALGAPASTPGARPLTASPLPRSLRLAIRVLPRDHRDRYGRELTAELYDVAAADRAAYTRHVIARSWALRAALCAHQLGTIGESVMTKRLR